MGKSRSGENAESGDIRSDQIDPWKNRLVCPTWLGENKG